MLKHALSHPTIEICGLIGGRDNQAISAYPIKNIADDPKQHFLMDPEEQINAMRVMRESNEILWGIYHSHPDTAATLSETDKKMAAYPDVYYLVISLAEITPKIACYYFNGKCFNNV